MRTPPGYLGCAQEDDGTWCVTARKPDGKHRWSFGRTIDEAMAEACAAAADEVRQAKGGAR